MDVNSLDVFSRLFITTKAQERADQQVDEYCRIKGCSRATYAERFSQPSMQHQYIIGLVSGALNEYHRQLRANLLEVGIDISDFVENALIQPED